MNRKPAGKPLIRQEKRFPQRGQQQSGRRSVIPGGDGTYPAGFVLSPAGTRPIRPDKRFPRWGQPESERISVVPAIKKPSKEYSILPSLKIMMKKSAILPFLTRKGSPVSLGIGQGRAPEGVGWGKIILAPLRYFSPPSLAQSGHGGNLASKKQEYWLQEPVQVESLKNKSHENLM